MLYLLTVNHLFVGKHRTQDFLQFVYMHVYDIAVAVATVAESIPVAATRVASKIYNKLDFTPSINVICFLCFKNALNDSTGKP
jgi:hypothetical protein